MNTLRKLHLYLGCLFAPMIVFFAVSGVWQRFAFEFRTSALPRRVQTALALLSTIHTGRGLKDGATLSSGWMTAFVIAMAVALILTIVLGVMLAFRFGHKKTALACLAGGVVIPLLICLVRVFA